jgi:hypothetical protein
MNIHTIDKQAKEASELLTENSDLAKIICDWCGRKYISRPFMCLCMSNVFLKEFAHEHANDK